MRLRGMNVRVWLATSSKRLVHWVPTRFQAKQVWPKRGLALQPSCARAGMWGSLPAVTLGAAEGMPEDADSASFSAELAASSGDWLVHPAWGVALLSLLAAAWFAYKRYADLQRVAANRSGSSDLYEAIFQSMPCPVFCRDADGKYLAVNRAYMQAFGAEEEFSPVQGPMIPHDSGYAVNTAESGGMEAIAAEGRSVCRFEVAPIQPDNGEPAWIGMFIGGESDNSPAQAKGDRLYSEGALDYALLSAINHDVRTPLTGVLGALELLGYSELTTRQRELLTGAEVASKTLHGILDDVLALAKLEAGLAPREHRAFDLRELIAEALLEFDGEAEIAGVLDERLEQDLVGDGASLRQALSKLVAHALSRKIGKRWRLEVRVLAQDAGWQSLECTLEPLQDGISPEVAISPFPTDAHRADELAWIMACKLCEWAGLVLQEQGSGWERPRFVVRGCFSQVRPRASSQHFVRCMNGGSPVAKAPAAILVVEDHELVREVIGRQLVALGWSCDLVGDGESALEAISRGAYSLLITDRYMPKMDGIELARRVRSRESAIRVPIVLLTANLPENEQQTFLEAGIDEVLCKPTNLHSLSTLLTKWLASGSDGDAAMMGRFVSQVGDDTRQVVERLQAVFGNDGRAIEDYLRLLRNEQGRLHKRVTDGDMDRIREVAHSLSGMGSFFGAQWLAGLATLVERGEGAASVLAHAGELSAYLIEFIASLRSNVCESSSLATSTNHVSDDSYRNDSGKSLEM